MCKSHRKGEILKTESARVVYFEALPASVVFFLTEDLLLLLP